MEGDEGVIRCPVQFQSNQEVGGGAVGGGGGGLQRERESLRAIVCRTSRE